MLTAGLLSGLMDVADLTSDPGLLTQAEDVTEAVNILSEELQRAALRGVVSAGVDTVINGGDLGQNLVNSLRTAAVITLGAQVAGEIGLATREGDLNYVANKIAHAALGAAMGEALSGDAAAGAIGAVVGEMAAEAFVQRFVYGQMKNSEALMNLTDEEALQLQADLIRLKSAGVDLGRLAAGIAAAVAERDIDTAATTGGNAAENNAFFVIPVLLEFMDKGLQAYDAYRLAKAIEAGNTDEAAEISAEIALGAATDAIPANVVAIKIGIAVKKFGLAGLGAKIVGKFADEAVEVASKSPAWIPGSHKSPQKFQNQMQKRGWTPKQIDEAMAKGQKLPAINNVNPDNTATRYVHPGTGRSVVVDDITREVLHVGGDGFKY
jgi:filamentous hemagglutinin